MSFMTCNFLSVTYVNSSNASILTVVLEGISDTYICYDSGDPGE